MTLYPNIFFNHWGQGSILCMMNINTSGGDREVLREATVCSHNNLLTASVTALRSSSRCPFFQVAKQMRSEHGGNLPSKRFRSARKMCVPYEKASDRHFLKSFIIKSFFFLLFVKIIKERKPTPMAFSRHFQCRTSILTDVTMTTHKKSHNISVCLK